VRGVIGWIELSDHHATHRIASLAKEPLIKGLRPMLQDIEDTNWILRPDVQPALTAMRYARLRLDLLVKPRHLPMLPELAQRHPELPMVIDHGAKPPIAEDAFQPWTDDIARLARETPWYCKLSGLVTEARADWKTDDLRRYVDHLIACFGTARLMWGSDWPVVNLAGGYARWREATPALLPNEGHDAILGDTAVQFYGL
jgi:L-fuconolactonase